MNLTKRIIALIALTLLVFHFTITLIFNLEIAQKNSFIQSYMVPFFNQKWKLFAPNVPTENLTIYFRYKTKSSENWSKWTNPAHQSYLTFSKNKFTHHYKLVRINSAICFYLKKESELKDSLNSTSKKNIFFDDKFKATGAYYLAKEYLKNWIFSKKSKNHLEKIQFCLVAKSNSSKKINVFHYPIFKF